MTKTCEICGKEYDAVRPNQVVCGDACRAERHRARKRATDRTAAARARNAAWRQSDEGRASKRRYRERQQAAAAADPAERERVAAAARAYRQGYLDTPHGRAVRRAYKRSAKYKAAEQERDRRHREAAAVAHLAGVAAALDARLRTGGTP